MKLILDIKNASKALNPQKNCVILYNGVDWYVTTKDDILKEDKALFDECQKELNEMKQLKKEVASQLLDMSELIKKLYSE